MIKRKFRYLSNWTFIKDLIFAFNANLLERNLNRLDFALLILLIYQSWLDLLLAVIRLSARLLTLGLLLILPSLMKQVLGFSICVTLSFTLVTPVALHAALEVVVLALAAHPATVRELKVLFLSCVTVSAITAHVKSASRVLLVKER